MLYFIPLVAWCRGNVLSPLFGNLRASRNPAIEYYSTLVHEMAHFLDHVRGVKPKSPGYHGKPWWATMERIGLPPVPGGKNGNSRISVHHRIEPGGAYERAFKDLPAEAVLPLRSLEGALLLGEPGNEPEGGQEKETKQGKRARYECTGDCGTTMRGPSGRKLFCVDCEAPYLETGF